jgi:hypothetical protein
VWLEQHQPGLGSDFLDMVDDSLEEIAQRPNACPTLVLAGVSLKLQLRWLGLARFPHVVIFHAAADEICIYGVVHPRQDLENVLVKRIGTQ